MAKKEKYTVYTVTKITRSYDSYGNNPKYVATYGPNQAKSEVKVYEQYRDQHGSWVGRITKSGSKKPEYVNMSYLSKTTKTDDSATSTSSTTSENYVINEKENKDEKGKGSAITGNTTKAYRNMLLKQIRAFGAPPRYTSQVDPYYSDNKDISAGRALSNTWYSNPAILSLCPGTVDYLPGFTSKKKNKFFHQIKDSMLNAGLSMKGGKNVNGKLYGFKTTYAEFVNVVNLLARTVADMLGIGDVNNIIRGTAVPLNKFDYGYYTNPTNAKGSHDERGMFREFIDSATADWEGKSYVHFFLNNANGANVNETISTSSGGSMLENYFGESSEISALANNMQFLFGGALTKEADSDIKRILDEASDMNSFLGGLGEIAHDYLKGGRLVFPKIITGMQYDKSFTAEMTFNSLYGDKRSIFKYVYLPALHLLALATPKQLSDSMYTYPFLIRAFCSGSFNSDLAYISGLEFTRGEGTHWTVDGLPTQITARITITPLYSNLMVTSTKNPLLYMQNTALLEYLGTMCGLDLKLSNFGLKLDLAKQLIKNDINDIPTQIARGVGEMINNKVTQITNMLF